MYSFPSSLPMYRIHSYAVAVVADIFVGQISGRKCDWIFTRFGFGRLLISLRLQPEPSAEDRHLEYKRIYRRKYL